MSEAAEAIRRLVAEGAFTAPIDRVGNLADHLGCRRPLPAPATD